jgi:hypothetical protein
MARLYLFAEGKTELAFADLVLTSHLANHGVYLKHRIEVAHARKNHTTHRGGGRKFGPVKRDIERFLKQEKGDDVHFTTMIDLYAIYADFPGLEAARKLSDPRKRVESLEESFARDIADPRFIPYLKLHEFEALLFVDASHFAKRYEKADKAIQGLQKIADEYESPELINDGPHTAPSKRLMKAFPSYERDKPRVGPLVARDIGLAAIHARCPHFHDWLTRLEGLGGKSP